VSALTPVVMTKSETTTRV
jgi:hypothetical protein